MIYENAIELIGNTPVIKLHVFEDENIADIYVKLEKYNIGGSVKDRAALAMIETAEKNDQLKKGYTIIEPSSGNTGISLALIAAIKGYDIIITMPESMSVERRNILKAYGAKIILTDAAKGMKGAIEEAEKLANEHENYYLPQQFNNPANPQIHYDTTGSEIINDFKSLDAFVAGVGTAGTLIGVGKKLKETFKDIEIIAVEPKTSAVLSGNEPGKHAIQGIGAGFIPQNYDKNIVDDIITVDNETAFSYGQLLAKKEGLFLGISSGANVAAAYEVAKKLGKGKIVLTIAPDGGEKYLSTDIYK